MNILYISKIDGRPWSGPSYSIPNQVKAQSKLDNVLWYNLIDNPIPEGKNNVNQWRKETYYIDLTTVSSGRIKDLPAPFSNPDLIIVEQGYPFAKCSIRKEITNSKIPYIVVPRGELTSTAQNKKKIKKIIGNIVLGYYGFMKKAVAIHFLTEQEKNETSAKWYSNALVIPNGTIVPSKKIERFVSEGVKCISIGRLEPFQKGLDLLIEACAKIKLELEKANCSIDLYGSNKEGKLEEIQELVEKYNMKHIISFHKGVFGEDKEKILRDADVFLMTSRFEGHPTGLLEALAYGLPCVVTTGANMRTEIENADAGWVADNDVDSIKSALLKMLNDKASYEEKGNNSYNLALTYGWDQIAIKSHSEYAKLIDKTII